MAPSFSCSSSCVKAFLVQAVLWTGMGVLIVFVHATLPSSFVPSIFVRVFGIGILFNVHQVVYRRFFLQRRYAVYGILLAVMFVAMGITLQGHRAWSMPGNISLWNFTEILREIVGCAICLGMVLGVYMFIHQLRSQYKTQEARALQAGAELKMLQAQINPHFLFNMMHSLYTLIELKSDKAQDVVLTMSDLMRYMYQTANAEMVRLQEEVINIERFLELQHIRLGKRADLKFEQSGDIGLWRVPPLLLLTLVENAFKHGVESTSTSAGAMLRVQLAVDEKHMDFVVENSVGGNTEKQEYMVRHAGEKTGLANVRRRLELLYPKTHELNIRDDGSFFSVTVKLWKTAQAY